MRERKGEAKCSSKHTGGRRGRESNWNDEGRSTYVSGVDKLVEWTSQGNG